MEYYNKAEFYKVTNESTEPFHMTWNKALMEDEDLERLSEFEKSNDYGGISEEDQAARIKVAAAVKMRPFLQMIGSDIQVKCYEKAMEGKNVITKTRYEWEFCIGPNIKKLIKEGNLTKVRGICQKFEIPFKREEGMKELTDKILKKFGPNYRVLKARQWEESGLMNLEKKEIPLAIKPGELSAKIVTEGYLVAEPLTDVDVEELKKKK